MTSVSIPLATMPRRRPDALLPLVLFELRLAARGRRLPAATALFALLAGAVTVMGLAAFREIGIGAASPAAIALLQLMLLVPTAFALVEGALALQGDREGGFLAMLRAAGVPGSDIAVAKVVAVTLTSWTLVAAGLGTAALVLAGSMSAADLAGYAALVTIALLTTAACAAIGVLVSAYAAARHQAVTAALALWFVLAIGLDLAIFAVAPFVRVGTAGLFVVLAVDPLEAGRVLGLLALGADSSVLGPLGTFLRATLGIGPAAGLLVAADVLWLGFATIVAGIRLSGRRG